MGGGGDGGAGDPSVWSAAALEAAATAPAPPSIDWNDIRENKDKYEELKWKGGGSFLLQCTGTRVVMIIDSGAEGIVVLVS